MSHEAKIHQVQTFILRELLFTPGARYADLRKKVDMDSDFFKFHIVRLKELGYITKDSSNRYVLTAVGKEYANKLDTDKNTIERQPKSAVIIVLIEKSAVLVQERLKYPYFGFWGYPSGKIRWGETILETAARELKEETRLAAILAYRGVYHEQVRLGETGEIIEDKIFHVIGGSQPHGTMVESFEGGRNAWIQLEEFARIKKKYLSCDIETQIGIGKTSFVEATQTYSKEEF